MTVRYFGLAVSLLLLPGLPAHGQATDNRASAPYVFLGTVTAPPSAATSPDAGRLVVVDEIYLQRGTFENQTGRQVEVLGVPARLQAKTQYVFYTEPVRFGQRIVVRLVDVGESTGVAAASQGPDAKQQAADAFVRREIGERAALAELVISGTVSSVRQLARTPATRDTEHDPDFRVAVVKVERALKGKPAGGDVEFVFAASKDVQWFQAPKFRIGDRGVMFLQRPAREATALGVSQQLLTLLHPSDYRPQAQLPAVEAALKAVGQ